jgi:membrane associated rhomboid family serine protease
MGLENRDYLRDDFEGGPGGLSFSGSSAIVKVIAATVAVFILQVLFTRAAGGSAVTQWLRLTADDLFLRGQIWRLLTYAFCHDPQNLFHIIFNMMALYSIGALLLNLVGQREFLWFYLTSAVFSGICSVVFYALMKQNVAIVGASGAVNAVFCAVAMHYPRQRLLLMGVIPIEMRWLLAAFIAFDTLPMITGWSSGARIAHAAHLGGLLFGFLYVRWNMQLTRGWDRIAGRVAGKRRNKGKLKLFSPPATTESNLDAQIDPILDKIAREGEASLTTRERNILMQASRKLKKDRS